MCRKNALVTRFCKLWVVSVKKTSPQPAKPEFQKTDVPCLYRYSSNGVYYALAKHEGKQKRASLETTDKAEAKRKPVDFLIDSGKELQVDQIVAIRVVDDEFGAVFSADVPGEIPFRKTGPHLVRRSGVQPTPRQVQFSAHGIHNLRESGRKRSRINKPDAGIQHVRDDQARLDTRQVTLPTNPRWSRYGQPGIFSPDAREGY